METVSEYLRSNVALLKNMIARGYGDARTLARRIKAMEAWLADPVLLEADADAEYAAVIEIDLDADHRADPGLPQRSRQRQTAQRGGGRSRSMRCSSAPA